jgi:3D (Asp-Asp-Asp) domain-containing protein
MFVSPAVVCGDDTGEQTLLVTATAYNSVAGQTDLEPGVAAWGDILEPGMKVIAVSRDLLALGLERGSPLSVDGLDGEYRVIDKMHTRWEKRIDIYMGEDAEAARAWGARLIRIRW